MSDINSSIVVLDQASATSRVPTQGLSSESVLDALKMILIDAPLKDVLNSVALLIEAHTQGMLCSIYLLDEDGLRLRYAAGPSLPDAFRVATDGVAIGPEVGSCGAAAYLRKPMFVADVLTHPHFAQFRDVLVQTGLRASWSSPIIAHHGKVLGTFGMYNRGVRHPSPAEMQLIDHASRIGGIAIDLPLKILIWEDSQGKVWVSYNSPAYLQERHNVPLELMRNTAVVETLAAKAAE